jgi:hypothetical protein
MWQCVRCGNENDDHAARCHCGAINPNASVTEILSTPAPDYDTSDLSDSDTYRGRYYTPPPEINPATGRQKNFGITGIVVFFFVLLVFVLCLHTYFHNQSERVSREAYLYQEDCRSAAYREQSWLSDANNNSTNGTDTVNNNTNTFANGANSNKADDDDSDSNDTNGNSASSNGANSNNAVNNSNANSNSNSTNNNSFSSHYNDSDQPCHYEPADVDFYSSYYYDRSHRIYTYHADLTLKNGLVRQEYLVINYNPMPKYQRCKIEIWNGRITSVIVNGSPIATWENPVNNSTHYSQMEEMSGAGCMLLGVLFVISLIYEIVARIIYYQRRR